MGFAWSEGWSLAAVFRLHLSPRGRSIAENVTCTARRVGNSYRWRCRGRRVELVLMVNVQR